MSPSRTRCDKEEVRAFALSLGFEACGFTSAEPLASAPLLAWWAGQGRHGTMSYLARDPQRRTSPRASLAQAQTVIVATWPYPAPPRPRADWRLALTGRIAAYALGGDYHDTLGEKLEQLASFLTRRFGAGTARAQVDAGPLLEKDLARRAGIGWFGHNTNVLSKRGSYFLLGCLLTDVPIEPDAPFEGRHCGTCRACIPACPTGALDSGPTIDAIRCISYLTIEHRGPIEPGLRPALGNWVFGCDVCQEVCPWNADHPPPSHRELEPWLPGLLAMDEEEFRGRFAKTAVARARRRGLARSAAVALGNSGNRAAAEPLVRAMRAHDEPLVRAHAAWALGRLAAEGCRQALEAAACSEKIPPVRLEIEAALAEIRDPRRTAGYTGLLPPTARE